MRLHKRSCTILTKLIEAITQIWYHDPAVAAIYQKFVEFKPNFIKLVLKHRGGHIH